MLQHKDYHKQYEVVCECEHVCERVMVPSLIMLNTSYHLQLKVFIKKTKLSSCTDRSSTTNTEIY